MSDTTGSADAGNPSGQTAGGETTTTTTTAAETKWYSGIENADIRGYAELKGWKDAGSAIESYRNLEKLQGVPAERLAKIPEASDTEGWKAFNAKFGWAAPETADKYDIPVPEGQRTDYAEKMKSVFHELGMPADKAKALVEKSNALQAELAAADEAALATSNANDLAKLKTEWGGNFDELSQLADRARKEILPNSGLTTEQLDLMEDLMGSAAMIRLFAAFGQKSGEAKFTTGGASNNGPMTPEAAQVRLGQIYEDRAWFARFEQGGAAEKQEWDRLNAVLANVHSQR